MTRSLEEQLADWQAHTDAVESTPPTMPEPEEAPVSRPVSIPRRWIVPACLLALLCILGGILYAQFNPFETTTATITIIPSVKTVTSSSTIILSPQPTKTASVQLQGRLLPRLTLTQVGSAPTTGRGHQAAQAASGTITFYNAAPYVQTVAAGTLLTGTDGVQLVTDADAVIPAAIFPTDGQATAPARAVLTGPAGNITRDDVYGACCRLNVFAVSSAFRGGQDARAFPMVTQSDLDEQSTALKASLTQSVTAAMQAQLHPGEALITPVPCTPKVTPDHPVGSEAAQLTVTVEVQCEGEAYATRDLRQLVTDVLNAQAAQQLEGSYQPVGTIQTSITHVQVTNAQQGTITLQVKGVGEWGYQLSDEQAKRIMQQVAGKSKQQATLLVAQQPGVLAVTISITGKQTTTLPTDVNGIHLLLVAPNA
jgi:VCBS repeat-containing protein